MEIQLIKYSSIDKAVVLITDEAVNAIHLIDSNNNTFVVTAHPSVQSSIGYVTTFKTISTNLTSDSEEDLSISGVAILKIINSDATVNDAAMYDSTEFAVLKADMLNAIKDTSDTKFYKYLVKLTFLELALNDVAKSSGDVEDTLSFYNEMIAIRDMFKAKYHYYDKL